MVGLAKSPAPESGPGNESCQPLVAVALWTDILLLPVRVTALGHRRVLLWYWMLRVGLFT